MRRGNGDDRVYWTSCNAGQNTLGIEADGTIKGCPSLSTSTYAGGNIRDLSLDNIWWTTDELNNRGRTSCELWVTVAVVTTPMCAKPVAPGPRVFCLAGRQQSLLPPSCARVVEAGLRERIAQVEQAPGTPFDHGRFELISKTPMARRKLSISFRSQTISSR